MGSGIRFWLCFGLTLACLTPLISRAQDQSAQPAPSEAPQPDLPIHTLHVYMDLIQVPVLVLDSEQGRIKPIDPTFFRASLDSGPDFRPRHVRQEGDDPITLGILLDTSTEPDAMLRIDKALASLAPRSLHAEDHVSVYVMNCGLVRSLQDIPANALVLQSAVDHGLEAWTLRHKLKHPPPCEKNMQLWDAIGFVATEIGSLPGRRVILAVTSGADSGSKTKWNDLRQFVQGRGVAIFGYSSHRDNMLFRSSPGGGSPGGRGSPSPISLSPVGDALSDPFRSLCEMSGGMVMRLDLDFLSRQLERFTATVRERYILEFARPRNDEPGEHSIMVTIPKKYPSAFIRPAGVTIMKSAASEDDATTLPRDQTDAPELGKRRPIKPN